MWTDTISAWQHSQDLATLLYVYLKAKAAWAQTSPAGLTGCHERSHNPTKSMQTQSRFLCLELLDPPSLYDLHLIKKQFVRQSVFPWQLYSTPFWGGKFQPLYHTYTHANTTFSFLRPLSHFTRPLGELTLYVVATLWSWYLMFLRWDVATIWLSVWTDFEYCWCLHFSFLFPHISVPISLTILRCLTKLYLAIWLCFFICA